MFSNSFTGGSVYRVDTATLSYLSRKLFSNSFTGGSVYRVDTATLSYLSGKLFSNSFTGGSVYRVDTATLRYLSTFNELSIGKCWTIIIPKSLENNWEFCVRLEKF